MIKACSRQNERTSVEEIEEQTGKKCSDNPGVCRRQQVLNLVKTNKELLNADVICGIVCWKIFDTSSSFNSVVVCFSNFSHFLLYGFVSLFLLSDMMLCILWCLRWCCVMDSVLHLHCAVADSSMFCENMSHVTFCMTHWLPNCVGAQLLLRHTSLYLYMCVRDHCTACGKESGSLLPYKY